MKNLKSITFVAIAGATLFAATAGAEGSSNQAAGQSNITSTAAASQSIKPKQLNISSGYVVGWLSDSKLLFVKENKDLWSVDPKSKIKYHPINIYVRDVGTGKETLLAANSTSVGAMGTVLVSPDQKYVFFTDAKGYNILNVSTGKAVNVLANVDFRTTNLASWSDNTHFVYYNSAGDINSVDVNGKIQTLLKTGQKRLGLPRVVGSTIYYGYTNADNSATDMSYNMQTKESTTFKEAYTVNPSPNGSQIAMVKDGALVLTDLKGNVKSTIATGDFYPIWSADGSKFAYISYSPQTLSVYDVKAGKRSQVAINKGDVVPFVYMSPTGKNIYYATGDGKNFIAALS